VESGVHRKSVAQNNAHPDARQRAVVACTAMAAFVFQFEANLVNVSLPTISAELELTTTYVSLIPISYLIATAAVLIPAGSLGVHFGLKRVFLCSVLLMTLGTAICGIPCPLPVIIGGRVLQGLGAGGMAALAYAMIPAHLPPSLTGYGYGRLSMAAGLGMLAGNPAGGMLAQFLPWRCVFLASIPLMLLLLLLAFRSLPPDRQAPTLKNQDFSLVDSLLIGFGAASAILILSFGKELGFHSTPMVSAFFALGISLTSFTVRERQSQVAFLPQEIIANRVFLVSLLSIILVCCSMGGIMFLMPFYFETSCRLSPAFTSVLMLANAAAYAVMGPFAGRMGDQGQARRILMSASLLGIFAYGLFAAVSGFRRWPYALAFLMAAGAANGMFFSPTNKTAIGSIPGALKQQAAVFVPLAVNMGNALGVALFETIFAFQLSPGAAPLLHIDMHRHGLIREIMYNGFMLSFLAGSLIWLMVMICISKVYQQNKQRRE
jgi:MFS family permease